MKEVQIQTQNLINMIKNSSEYNQYQRLLKNMMQDPVLYGKLNEFRRKSIALQLGNQANLVEGMNALRQESAELLMNPGTSEFLFAEQQYCKMIRVVQTQILEATEIDIDFLEG